MSSDFQPDAVLYYQVGFAKRQLSTVATATLKADLIDFIEQNRGTPEGDWYRFSQLADLQATMQKTRDLGRNVYNLLGPIGGP